MDLTMDLSDLRRKLTDCGHDHWTIKSSNYVDPKKEAYCRSIPALNKLNFSLSFLEKILAKLIRIENFGAAAFFQHHIDIVSEHGEDTNAVDGLDDETMALIINSDSSDWCLHEQKTKLDRVTASGPFGHLNSTFFTQLQLLELRDYSISIENYCAAAFFHYRTERIQSAYRVWIRALISGNAILDENHECGDNFSDLRDFFLLYPGLLHFIGGVTVRYVRYDYD